MSTAINPSFFKDTTGEKLDKREISLGESRKYTFSTQGTQIIEKKMSFAQKVLNILSNPNVAYILMLLGIYGLFFELTNPGAIFPGVLGAISLILALYSLHIFPINFTGVLLLLLSLILFLAEIFIVSHGVLAVGGAIAFFLGSMMLIDASVPFFQISTWTIGVATFFTVGFFAILLGAVVKAHKRKPITGQEGIVGEIGEVLQKLKPEGKVFLHGEIWNAISYDGGEIPKGKKVKVISIEGMRLKVKPLEDERAQHPSYQ